MNITTSPGSGNFRALQSNEGSLVGTLGSGANPSWGNISLGSTNYAGNLTNGKGSTFPNASTGAKQLNLGIVTIGSGTTQEIDIIRRPNAGESAKITAERYFAQASLKILLSDDPQDIMGLPCIDSATQPFDLSKLARPVNLWPAAAPYSTLKANMTAAGANYVPLPLAAAGAMQGTTNSSNYSSADGYWLPNPGPGLAYPIVKGFIKIEAQTLYGNPCGTWRDVTVEILGLGYVGKNINPLRRPGGRQLWCTRLRPLCAPLPVPALGNSIPTAAQLGLQNAGGTCPDPHPNAVIRLERVRDNPSNWTNANRCGALEHCISAL